MSTDDPLAIAAVEAIQAGDVPALHVLLPERPGLASVRLGDERMSRTLLYVATD
ncbi:hypothetical protein PV341_17985 [Streptomyces sp. PA03-1a]|nr:hypothetical protein [Streptomyces sp. PA03-1a]MDX2819112.1 hypothetical protein [Streptomyces sp. PA03-5A]